MEEYSAHHSETVEELLEWPALRFERFHEAFQKRITIDEMKLRKITMIAAIYANSNYDGEENSGKRDEFAQALEDNFRRSVRDLYRKGPSEEELLDQHMKENPFFANIQLPE